jgi:hypothetical protein
MYEFDVPTIFVSVVITWGVGLLPPILIRYAYVKGPLDKHEAIATCVALGIFNLFLFLLLGSQSKSHMVLILIAIVSYAILRRKSAPKESVPADTRATEVLATGERWYKKMIFRPSWRLAVSVIPLAFLLALVAFYIAAGESQQEVAHYQNALSKWTPEKRARCEELLAEERAKAPTYGFEERIFSVALEMECTPPKLPEEGMYYYYLGKNLREVFLPWVILSAVLFANLTAISTCFNESEKGWRRLSIVMACLLTVISGLITLVSIDGGAVEKVVIAFLSAAATFPVGILLILGGRSVVKWVRDGFATNKGGV